MAGGGLIAAAAGAAALGGAEVMASDDGSEADEATGPVGTTLSLLGAGAALERGSAAECQRPSCQEENASVTINAPTASAPKSIRLFTSGPGGKTGSIADNHDNLVRRRAGNSTVGVAGGTS